MNMYLLKNIEDTGLKDETIKTIINEFLNKETIDVRTISLPTDKKVNYVDGVKNNDYLFKCEVCIFRKIVEKLKNEINKNIEIKNKGYTNELLNSLSTLDDKSILIYFTKGCSDNLINIIVKMSKLDDYSGSHQIDLFEKNKQKTIDKNHEVDYTKRIYLNIPLNNVGAKFLTVFKLKCIEKGIPSKMKGFGSSAEYTGELDTTIIYTNDYYLIEHMEIIESIIKERPDLVSKFGSPVISGGRMISSDGNNYYTISSGLLGGGTSNDYYDAIYKKAYYIMCMKYFDSNYNESSDYFYSLINKSLKDRNLIVRNNEYKEVFKNRIKEGSINAEQFTKEFKEMVKKVSSITRFNDLEHTEVPLYQDQIFIDFINNSSKVKEENSAEESKEENIYLYKTEKLFDSAFSEYLKSDKPNYEKAEEYVKRVNYIEKEFRHAVHTTNGFAGSDRYKQVIEYIKKIPMFEEFKEDEKLLPGYNSFLKRKYYENISNQLEEYVSIMKEKDSKKIDI